jgi:hypothetical protein
MKRFHLAVRSTTYKIVLFFLVAGASSASAGQCHGMNDKIACKCALQNGGYIAVWGHIRKAMYPIQFMDQVGKCIRDAKGG